MIDLQRYKELWEDYKHDSQLNEIGKLNQVAYMGERVGPLVSEVEKLRAALLDKITKRKFKPGDQIACIPLHVDYFEDGEIEFGFVTSVKKSGVFCRYWNDDLTDLRTKSNSELTPFRNLIHWDSVSWGQLRHAVVTYNITAIDLEEAKND